MRSDSTKPNDTKSGVANYIDNQIAKENPVMLVAVQPLIPEPKLDDTIVKNRLSTLSASIQKGETNNIALLLGPKLRQLRIEANQKITKEQSLWSQRYMILQMVNLVKNDIDIYFKELSKKIPSNASDAQKEAAFKISEEERRKFIISLENKLNNLSNELHFNDDDTYSKKSIINYIEMSLLAGANIARLSRDYAAEQERSHRFCIEDNTAYESIKTEFNSAIAKANEDFTLAVKNSTLDAVDLIQNQIGDVDLTRYRDTDEYKALLKAINERVVTEIKEAAAAKTAPRLNWINELISRSIVDVDFKLFLDAIHGFEEKNLLTAKRAIYTLMKNAYEYIRVNTPDLTLHSKIELDFKIKTLTSLLTLLQNTRSMVSIDPESVSLSDQERYNYGVAAKEHVDRLTLELTVASWLNQPKLFTMRNTLPLDATKLSAPVFKHEIDTAFPAQVTNEKADSKLTPADVLKKSHIKNLIEKTSDQLSNGKIEEATLNLGPNLLQPRNELNHFIVKNRHQKVLLEIKKQLAIKTHHLLLAYLAERTNTLNELIFMTNEQSDLPALFGIKPATKNDIDSFKKLRNSDRFGGRSDEQRKQAQHNILQKHFDKVLGEERAHMIASFKKKLSNLSEASRKVWQNLDYGKVDTHLAIISRGFLEHDYLTSQDKTAQLANIKKELTNDINDLLDNKFKPVILDTLKKEFPNKSNEDIDATLLHTIHALRDESLKTTLTDIVSELEKGMQNSSPIRFALLRLDTLRQKTEEKTQENKTSLTTAISNYQTSKISAIANYKSQANKYLIDISTQEKTIGSGIGDISLSLPLYEENTQRLRSTLNTMRARTDLTTAQKSALDVFAATLAAHGLLLSTDLLLLAGNARELLHLEYCVSPTNGIYSQAVERARDGLSSTFVNKGAFLAQSFFASRHATALNKHALQLATAHHISADPLLLTQQAANYNSQVELGTIFHQRSTGAEAARLLAAPAPEQQHSGNGYHPIK